MTPASTICLISIIGEDRSGLIAEVSGYLFDVGADLRDTSFAVLGAGCEFSCVAAVPANILLEDVETGLTALPSMDGATISVKPFAFSEEHEPEAEISHVFEIIGGDRPGLIARLSEVFVGAGANVVRMTSRRIERRGGGYDYRTRFSVHIPAGREVAATAAIANLAGQLQLEYFCNPVAPNE